MNNTWILLKVVVSWNCFNQFLLSLNKSIKEKLVVYDSFKKVLVYGGYVIALVLLILSIYIFPDLPPKVPTHINLSGTPNQFGNKTSIFIWPIVIFVLSISQNRFHYIYGQRIFSILVNLTLIFAVFSILSMYYNLLFW